MYFQEQRPTKTELWTVFFYSTEEIVPMETAVSTTNEYGWSCKINFHTLLGHICYEIRIIGSWTLTWFPYKEEEIEKGDRHSTHRLVTPG